MTDYHVINDNMNDIQTTPSTSSSTFYESAHQTIHRFWMAFYTYLQDTAEHYEYLLDVSALEDEYSTPHHFRWNQQQHHGYSHQSPPPPYPYHQNQQNQQNQHLYPPATPPSSQHHSLHTTPSGGGGSLRTRTSRRNLRSTTTSSSSSIGSINTNISTSSKLVTPPPHRTSRSRSSSISSSSTATPSLQSAFRGSQHSLQHLPPSRILSVITQILSWIYSQLLEPLITFLNLSPPLTITTHDSNLLHNHHFPISSLYETIPPQHRKTLILDLDETLIHSTSRGTRHHDHMIEVLVDKHVVLYYVYKRPHVDFFLKKVSEWFHCSVFTASMSEYAEPVIDWLDNGRHLFSSRYYREHCMQHNGTYVKNMSLVNPDLSQTVLVDNSPISYALHQENAVPIDSWVSDERDERLLDLLPFLDALRVVEDVRSVLGMRL